MVKKLKRIDVRYAVVNTARKKTRPLAKNRIQNWSAYPRIIVKEMKEKDVNIEISGCCWC